MKKPSVPFRRAILPTACLEVQDTFAAERLDPRVLLQQTLHSHQRSTEPVESFLFKRHGRRLPRGDLDDLLNLGSDTELEQLKVTTTSQGTKLFKLQQTYQGKFTCLFVPLFFLSLFCKTSRSDTEVTRLRLRVVFKRKRTSECSSGRTASLRLP